MFNAEVTPCGIIMPLHFHKSTLLRSKTDPDDWELSETAFSGQNSYLKLTLSVYIINKVFLRTTDALTVKHLY